MQNQFKETGHETFTEISELPLEKLRDEVENLRDQINDEYEYATVVQVFSGAFSGLTGKVFLARESGKIAGIGVVSLQSKTEGTLEALYIPKEYRKKGIGSSLAEAQIQYLLNIGVKKIYINTTSAGSRNIAHTLKSRYGNTVIIKDQGDYFD